MLSTQERAIVKEIETLGRRMGRWEVWRDWCEMGALAVANSVDLGPRREKREERYLQIIRRYDADEQAAFPRLIGMLALALDGDNPTDVLGRVYQHLELANKGTGQFFTPYDLCEVMARTCLGDGEALRAQVEREGFVTLNEPCVGGGALVIAAAKVVASLGLDYQHVLHVTAQDIDPACIHMAYLQLSLLSIPAVVIHGNTLAVEAREAWYTPAHILGGWDYRLRARRLKALAMEAAVPQEIEEPAPAPAAKTETYSAVAAAPPAAGACAAPIQLRLFQGVA